MEQIIKHEQCLRCRECCRFREDRQYFAPLFTRDEIDQIAAVRGEILPEFTPYGESGRVFQIKLTRSKLDDPDYPYVCPFLDEDRYMCSIYETRPFDCRLWPMLIHRIRQTGQTLLSHFTGEVCLAMKEIDQAALDTYTAYFARLVSSEKMMAFLAQHPELIWEHDEEGSYRTIPIAEITIEDAKL